jgi:exosortase/archaeosortase family protein
MRKEFSKFFDVAYFARFLIIFLGLFYFNLFFYGITIPKGLFYSSFLANSLNYIHWLTSFILYGANLITHVFGFPTHIEEQLTIRIYDRRGVDLNYACLGLGIISFWVAFVTAHTANWRKKIRWCLAGIIAICFINCWRIALLLISMEQNWRHFGSLDHHDLFNFGSYMIIFYMICHYNSANNKENNPIASRQLTKVLT